MILKRLILTAFGAFGLGMLATGPVLGQTESNIPSPDGFDNQLDCARNAAGVMLAMPNAATGPTKKGPSALDSLLRGGADAKGDVKTLSVSGPLTELFPVTANCGTGTIGRTSAAYDLAQGYNEVRLAWEAVRDARTRVMNAEETSGVSSTTAQNARAALAEAQQELTTLSQGPIYQAGIAEWDSLAAVETAIKSWNDAVSGTSGANPTVGYTMAKSTLNNSNYSGYRPISLGAYNATSGVYEGGAGNFDANGVFQRNAGPNRPAETGGTVGTISGLLEDIDQIIADIDKDLAATPASEAARRTALTTSKSRAETERSYIQTQLNNAYLDNTDLDAGTDGVQSIATRRSTYLSAESAVTAAESALRQAVTSRVAMSQEVQKAFRSADSYLQQNVHRHTYLVSQATQATRAAAQTKLDAATELRNQFEAYFGTPGAPAFNGENPAGELLNALLTPSTTTETTVVLTDANGNALEKRDVNGNAYYVDDNGNRVGITANAAYDEAGTQDSTDEIRVVSIQAQGSDYITNFDADGGVDSVTDAAGNKIDVSSGGSVGTGVANITDVTIGGRTFGGITVADDGSDADDLVDITLTTTVTGTNSDTTASTVTKADGSTVATTRSFVVAVEANTVATNDEYVAGAVVGDLLEVLSVVETPFENGALGTPGDPEVTRTVALSLARAAAIVDPVVKTNNAAIFMFPTGNEDLTSTANINESLRLPSAADYTSLVNSVGAFDVAYQTKTIADITDKGDDGQALIDAIDTLHRNTVANNAAASDAKTMVEGLTATDDPETEADETGAVTANSNRLNDLLRTETDDEGNEVEMGRVKDIEDDISDLTGDDGVVAANTNRVENIETELMIDEDGNGTIAQDDGSTISRLDDIENKLGAKKDYIEAIQDELMIDNEGNGTREDGRSRIGELDDRVTQNSTDIAGLTADTDAGAEADGAVTANRKAIAQEATNRAAADDAVRGEFAAADTAVRGEFAAADDAVRGEFAAADTAEMEARMAADSMLSEGIGANTAAIGAEMVAREAMDMELHGMIGTNSAAISSNTGGISSNASAISANSSAISANSGMISTHTQQISGLTEELDVVRAGVAAGIAMASMPPVNGQGISVGVGSYDGESAFAVGYHYTGERVNFQIGITSASGETGAGAGISFSLGQ